MKFCEAHNTPDLTRLGTLSLPQDFMNKLSAFDEKDSAVS